MLLKHIKIKEYYLKKFLTQLIWYKVRLFGFMAYQTLMVIYDKSCLNIYDF